MASKVTEFWTPKRLLKTIFRIFLVMGGRGVGKTFNVTGEALDDLFFHNVSMMYLRRQGVEIDELEKNNFITETMLRVYFGARLTNYTEDDAKQLTRFAIDGNIHELKVIRNKIFFDDRCIVYFVALRRAGHIKSNNYPDVKYLVYDEVIIDRSIMPGARYIQNEFTVLLNLIETVKRDRKDFYLFLLSNVGENFNPIFAGLNYYLTNEDIEKGFIEKENYCIEMVENKEEELDLSDPFVRMGLANQDFKNSKTNAFENIRTPYFKAINRKPKFVIKYNRSYLGIVERAIPSGTECYYQKFDSLEELGDLSQVTIYNRNFDTLTENEEFLTDIFMKKTMSKYFEFFQKNMVYHQNPESFIAWSKMVYEYK